MPIKNVEDAMHEFKAGSSKIKSKKQAIAIGLSKERGKKSPKRGKGKTFAAIKGLAKFKGK